MLDDLFTRSSGDETIIDCLEGKQEILDRLLFKN